MTALPPLPQSDHIINTFDGTGILGMGQVDGYTAAQMQAYALAAIAAIAKDRERQSVPAFDSVRLTRFLTDVVTAAGLLSHGKQSKAVAERVAKEACAIRSMLAAAPQPQPVQYNLADFSVSAVLRDMGGFAPVNTSGVKVTHVPSGLSVTETDGRTQHVNRNVAFEKLIALIAAQGEKTMNITIDRKVIEQARDALNHGIAEMNNRGCAVECMPLHRATRALREALAQPQPVQEPVFWLPIETAPKDSSMLRLLVNFDDHSLEDGSDPCWTIGTNALSDTGVDEWLFAGWDWTHDRFTQGTGTPIGWLPMLYTPPQAEQPLTPEWYARWIRNNYQDHPNIATLCEELTKAAHGITKGTT